MMNAHHMQQQNNAHMMQVDQVNAPQQQQQAPQQQQQQHRPMQQQVSLQRQLSHDPNIKQQQQALSHPLQQQIVAKNIQEILVKTEDDQEQRDAEKQRKKGSPATSVFGTKMCPKIGPRAIQNWIHFWDHF